jgi:ribonuclease HII
VIVPSLRRERSLWNGGHVRIAGVDEVGVAPTSGAVVAAAVIMKAGCKRIPGVRDSKTLSAGQREKLYPIIRRRAFAVGVGAASVPEIDRLNIYHATHLAMRRAIHRLGGHDHVLVDGNRIAGFEGHVGPYTAIVDGDALCYTIACASVIAKVVRDRMMTLLSARYPQYGWDRNSGYATREHRAAMRAYGLTPFHRRSFPAVHATIAGEQQVLDFDFDPAFAALAEDELAEAALLAAEGGPSDDGAGVAVMIEPGKTAVGEAQDKTDLELELA